MEHSIGYDLVISLLSSLTLALGAWIFNQVKHAYETRIKGDTKDEPDDVNITTRYRVDSSVEEAGQPTPDCQIAASVATEQSANNHRLETMPTAKGGGL